MIFTWILVGIGTLALAYNIITGCRAMRDPRWKMAVQLGQRWDIAADAIVWIIIFTWSAYRVWG